VADRGIDRGAAFPSFRARIWVVTLYQWGNDEAVVTCALALAVAGVVLLTRPLSTRRETGFAGFAATAQGEGSTAAEAGCDDDTSRLQNG
jgi:hypothetical protein